MKAIGFLHAHYSNIRYFEKALEQYSITLHHFVDPGLLLRMSNDPTFTAEEAKKKVLEQLHWMSKVGIDAIVITCTNYSALLNDTSSLNIPIINIDEPFFKAFAQLPAPKKLIFTNPETVKGTTKRLNEYLYKENSLDSYLIEIIPNAFNYLMDGNTKLHNEIVFNKLSEMTKDHTNHLAIAQLSMVEAGENIHTEILNPLSSLIEEIIIELKLFGY